MIYKPHNFIAIDLGASNGRVIRGRLHKNKLEITLIHRFEHSSQTIKGHVCWNWELITNSVNEGLYKTAEAIGDETIESISCDSWSQDFGFLDKNNILFYPPVSYRDSRTEGMPQSFSDVIKPNDLIKQMGSTINPCTTLCQLRAIALNEPEIFDRAATMLFIADLIHYNLCGEKTTDWTLATASQLYNLRMNTWDENLLKSLQIPGKFLPPLIVSPGILGHVTPKNAPHSRLVGIPVIIGSGHDTAAVSAAIPSLDRGVLFLNLGTWSMLGCYTGNLVIPECQDDRIALLGLPFAKWGVFYGQGGLWLIQECRRIWQNSGLSISYESLVKEAESASITSRVDISSPRFKAPENMINEISQACKEDGYSVPVTPGEFAKVVFDSLVHNLAVKIEMIQKCCEIRSKILYLVGGGVRNTYLCRQIANVLRIPVVSGPSEAAAIGNIITQARVTNIISTGEQSDEILLNSFAFMTTVTSVSKVTHKKRERDLS
jgi:rhamnulokinase